MRKLLLLLICLLLSGCYMNQNDFEKQEKSVPMAPLSIAPANILEVVYSDTTQEGEDSFSYAVLNLALEKSGVEYTLELSPIDASQERLSEMILNDELDIADFGTSKSYESILLPIYIPLDMGLSGWRVCIVNESVSDKFQLVRTMDQLRQFVFGQGLGWADTEILIHNKFEVLEAQNIQNALMMLSNKRFDVMPLGINEVYKVYDDQIDQSKTVVDDHLIIKYPFGKLFFVNKNNQALHDAVYNGLRIAFDDGSYMELFESFPQNNMILERINEQTLIFELDNPYTTESFNSIPDKYFYKIGK